jgi:cathepsin F/cysteine peptidase B
MKFLVLACLIAVAFALSPMEELAQTKSTDADWTQFVQFVADYNRTYSTTEEAALRLQNFKDTLTRSAQLMKENPEAQFGVNKFADMSTAEFRSKYLMPVNITEKYKPKTTKKWTPQTRDGTPITLSDDLITAATSMDWSANGHTTPVKDQGQCGSCWAFSATEVVESANIFAGVGKSTGPILGPEEIVDCDRSMSGCNGGDPRQALDWVTSTGGLEMESSYPYTAGQSGRSGSCKFNKGLVKETVTGGSVDVSDGNEAALAAFLQSQGPPSVCVDASSWQSYTGGVMSSCGCNIDHAVQAVGINADFANSYKIRNSWNTDWGVKGYIYLKTGQNTCCVAHEVSWATNLN